MRRFALSAAFVLGGCTTHAPAAASADSAPPVPVRGDTPGHVCQLTGTEEFIGQPANDETQAAIQRVSNAAVLRLALPNSAMTMDFRNDRVTVYLGPDRKITKITCG